MLNENYYTIQGWMINKLHLKGTALNVYAIIYGFTQDGESEFKGSRQYLSDFTGATRPTIDKALQELIDAGYIIKLSETINNVTFNRYKINIGVLKNFTGCKETLQGCKETLHNNININKETIYNNIYVKESKHKYGEYGNVLLTDKEVETLKKDYGEDLALKAIDFMDEYIEMKGYKAKSHYLAIRKWVFDAMKEDSIKKERINAKTPKKLVNERSYSKAEIDTLYSNIDEISKNLGG